MDWMTVLVGVVGMAATIVGSVIGARVGGKAVKESVFIAAQKAREAEQERDRQEIANVRKALLAEIVTLKERYMDGIGQRLESHPADTPFVFTYPANQRYFVIFEENAHLIGKIQDDKERDLIVQAYTRGKALLDSYHYNNSWTEKRNYAVGLAPVVIGQNFRPVLAEIDKLMAGYTSVLKRLHHETLAVFEELRASLERPLS